LTPPHGIKQPPRIDEMQVPRNGSDEVLVEVTAAGLCRSDFQLSPATSANVSGVALHRTRARTGGHGRRGGCRCAAIGQLWQGSSVVVSLDA
jgi:D-arabinose 1-dehydrogenase-like Zn-dependent alcohol dehydrogenase